MAWQEITLTSKKLCGFFPQWYRGIKFSFRKKKIPNIDWDYSKQNNQQLTSICHAADLETESYRSVIINIYNECRPSSTSCQCWNLFPQMMLKHLGILCFIVCSSDSAVFLAATTSFFPCVTDCNVSNTWKFATGLKLCSSCALPRWVLSRSLKLAWEPLWCMSMQTFTMMQKSWIYTISLWLWLSKDSSSSPLWDIYLYLMGRILLKHCANAS